MKGAIQWKRSSSVCLSSWLARCFFPSNNQLRHPWLIYIEGQPEPVKSNLGCLPALVLLGLLAMILLGIGVS